SPCIRSRILIVTEEDSDLWCDRRDTLGLDDQIDVLINPFFGTPTLAEWRIFVDRLVELTGKNGYDLVILDTLFSMWSVENENDAGEQRNALLPLRALKALAAVLLVGHLKKGDGLEGTGTRGSGALMAFVDTIIELRRADANDIENSQRVLTTLGRWSQPGKLTVELDIAAGEFRAIDCVAEQSSAKSERARLRRDSQFQQDRADEAKALEAIRGLVAADTQTTLRQVRLAADLSPDRTEKALFRLQREDIVRRKTLPPKKGQFGELEIYVITATESQRD
ncbi:MAG: hypothetical protein WCL32_24930, partial [Planctomycetota bacterium]